MFFKRYIKAKFTFLLPAVFALFYMHCMGQNLKSQPVKTGEHPRLILTPEGVAQIRSELGKIPLFDKTLQETKNEVDHEIVTGIHVPIPKDYSGGYTHERHKQNFYMMQKAGVLFQILGDEKYAVYVRDMLMAYAKMYPTLPLHPVNRSYSRGKLFWQALNDANWLVYTSQAYDCIYNWLSVEDRAYLEKDLFRPFADFLSIGNPRFFNRVHNHSTWGTVAVGMIALVMDDQELLDRALYGIKNDHIPADAKDDDGGLIKIPGQKVGYFGNLDAPFSPDGYYTEGPYYQRFAMYPFLIFAEALQNTHPEFKVFDYKNGVLIKAVHALLNLTDAKGLYFPLNDAQKGMSYYSRETVMATDVGYYFGHHDPTLLGMAQQQGRVTLDDPGMAVALAVRDGKAQPYVKNSVELRDGQNGDHGGVGILRGKDLELVFKYTSQGLSHGHYDKLSYSFYNKGDEVLQDYGMARFVNIEQKGGGNYLKENKTWAKQTVAHNTLVQNESSDFKGDYQTGSQFHSNGYLFDVSDPNLQVVSATDEHAYPGTKMQRTFVMINDPDFENPIVLDILNVNSLTANQYDLPFYYLGQLLDTNLKYETPKVLQPLGKANGYEHLYLEGTGISDGGDVRVDWMNHDVFYSLTTTTANQDKLIFARIGANDPNFDLRRDPAFILRREDAKDALFVSLLETHGFYSPVTEVPQNLYSNLKSLEVVYHDSEYTAVKIFPKRGSTKLFILSTKNNSKSKKHILKINEGKIRWRGAFTLQSINN